MEPNTHLLIHPGLCGQIQALSPGRAEVALLTLPEMAADDRGLVHGGFVFGLADYAAMLAVNDPHVVLGAAEVRFLAPARVGQTILATAILSEEKGRRRIVSVEASADGRMLFSGRFVCVILEQHVLDA